MEPKARSLTSRILLLVLLPSALASLVGGGVLEAERLGMVTLRRVPGVFLLPAWNDGTGETVAIVNTDVTPGSFLLVSEEEPSTAQRIWVPARSFVLRRRLGTARSCNVGLYHGRVPERSARVFYSDSLYRASPRFVPRGTVVTIEWEGPLADTSRGFFEIVKGPGVSLVPAPGLEIGETRCISAKQPNRRSWDVAYSGTDDRQASLPATRIFTSFYMDTAIPVRVDIDSTTPAPSVFEVWAKYYEMSGDVSSSDLVIHDPDMNVIDERDAR